MAGCEDGAHAGRAGWQAAEGFQLVADRAVDGEGLGGEALRELHFDAVELLHGRLDFVERGECLLQVVDFPLGVGHSLLLLLALRDEAHDLRRGGVARGERDSHLRQLVFRRGAMERRIEVTIPLGVFRRALVGDAVVLVAHLENLAALAHAVLQRLIRSLASLTGPILLTSAKWDRIPVRLQEILPQLLRIAR